MKLNSGVRIWIIDIVQAHQAQTKTFELVQILYMCTHFVKFMIHTYTIRCTQVLVRWSLDRGVSVLPKSVSAERIHSNLHGALGWRLREEEMRALSGIGHQKRQVDGSFWVSAGGAYKSLEELWA